MPAKKPGHPVRGSHTGRPIMLLLDVLGQRWSLRILWELRERRLTFRQLQAQCDDISPTSLNTRLKQLRVMDLVDHTEAGFGYTRWGEELGQQLLTLNTWSKRWGRHLQQRDD